MPDRIDPTPTLPRACQTQAGAAGRTWHITLFLSPAGSSQALLTEDMPQAECGPWLSVPDGSRAGSVWG